MQYSVLKNTHLIWKISETTYLTSLMVHHQVGLFFFYMPDTAEPNGRWLTPKREGDLTQVTARLLS